MRIPARDNFEAIIKADSGQRIYTSWRYYSRLHCGPFIARLKIASRLLGERRYANLLDLGFGSGFFAPELSLHCDQLFGVDMHQNIPVVKGMLNREGVRAHLAYGDILRLPWKDASFDCVVCLSVLEFVEDIRSAMMEIERVARDNATILIGAPVLNKLTDFCYDRLIQFSHRRILHKSGQEKIREEAEEYFKVEQVATYPFFLPFGAALFFVIKATKKR
jgi:ubiquinone/menaquinone biosynthesis C-methylase UbiE